MEKGIMNYLRKDFKDRVQNERGAALVFSFLVLSVLLTFTAGFAMSSTTELNFAKRYQARTDLRAC